LSYATQANLIDRYGEDALLVLADRDLDSVIDVVVVQQALDDATAEINAYVGAKYSLPLPIVPDVLVRLCGDIAMYRLAVEANQATDERRTRYEDAIAFLKDVSRGVAALGIPDAPPSSNGGVTLISDKRQFTRRNMRRLM